MIQSGPNWAEFIVALKRPGVTLRIPWEEYRAVHPDGYGYSRFRGCFAGSNLGCRRRRAEGALSAFPTRRAFSVMRQDHVAGDKTFVDYSGKKLAIVDPLTGEIREAEIFIAVLGASNYTPDQVRGKLYAEATWTQALPDWTCAHVRMFRCFGGVPRLIVPPSPKSGNPKSGVNRACFYVPKIDRSYGMMTSHYGVGVLPARPRKPRE